MNPIIEYFDYRALLRDFLEASTVSQREHTRRAGFSSPSYLKTVLDGRINISEKRLPQFAKMMELDDDESEYFFNLVRYNQAKSIEAKNWHYQKLLEQRSEKDHEILDEENYHYLSAWHHSAVRELVEFKDFRPDPQWIVDRLKGAITKKEARESLKLLKKLNLIEETKKGSWHQVDTVIRTPAEAYDLAVTQYHRSSLRHAEKSIAETTPEDRDLSAMMIGLSDSQIAEIKSQIQRMRKNITSKINKEQKPVEKIYRLSIQLLPIAD